jgi:hypothetical protein
LKIANILSALLLASAISLALGGLLLFVNRLVPLILLDLTATAVIVITPLSFFVYRRNLIAINVSTILGFVAPTISLSTPAHIEVLFEFGRNSLLSVLALLQVLGFYAMPIAFLIIRFAYWKRISEEVEAESKGTAESKLRTTLKQEDPRGTTSEACHIEDFSFSD